MSDEYGARCEHKLLSPDIGFIQECGPGPSLPLRGQFLTYAVNTVKGIALGSLSPAFQVAEMGPMDHAGRAYLAASVSGPVSFTALGIWSQAPKYVDDVLRTLDAYADVLGAAPAVVMGDFNSGTDLTARTASRGHARIVQACSDLGLVSAYHAFHGVEHGHETVPTYHHQFKAIQPWHIDFCFVPAAWTSHLTRVEVLTGADWEAKSDHRPLVVQFGFSK